MAWFGRGGGRGYGRGMGLGRGYWAGMAPGTGWGRGLGNPNAYCRFYPWMPRRWWAMGMSPYGPAAPRNPQGSVGPQWSWPGDNIQNR
jgi:hypothetical protein